jgi:methylated-DNA-[protein]-cysteine S-methyltransferase
MSMSLRIHDPSDARHGRIVTELGELTLVAHGACLTGVYFPGHWPRPSASAYGRLVSVADDPVLNQARSELEEYLTGRRTSFDLPTRATGTPFQERVWALLSEIPFGTTTTYGALAEQLGERALAQEVGQAVGRNPLSIVVPCHRVVGSGGRLTGYAGGLDRKRRLLELEEPAALAAERLF